MAVNKGLAGIGRSILAVLLTGVLSLGVFGCAKPIAPQTLISEPTGKTNRLSGQLEEVSPPEGLQTLKQIIDAYDPQVRVLSPRPGEVIESTTVSVRFQVRGLPLFKDRQWGLGPHLHVFLDDEPYRAVYDLSEPLVLSDLAPGTHTLRVFASRPWHESFKNQGAFDQRTFHVFAQTPQKALDKNQPLLTYSRPQGTYGAEPIMLDFYLTNAPLHMIAQEDSQDEVADWRIRCTINGQSFVFDQWQPIYLKGFKPGQNWIQLELIDEDGNLIENAFNNTVRVITYEPGGNDALSKLVRGELALQEVAGIIDPTYVPPMQEMPQPEMTLPESSPESEDEPPMEIPEPAQPEEDQSPAADLPDAEKTEAQQTNERTEVVPESSDERAASEVINEPEETVRPTNESRDEAAGTPVSPDREEALDRDRNFQTQQQAGDQLNQNGKSLTAEPNEVPSPEPVPPAQPFELEQEVDIQPETNVLKDAVESLEDSVNSLEEAITENGQSPDSVTDSLKKTMPEADAAQQRSLESATEDLKSSAKDLESSADVLQETLPEASAAPQLSSDAPTAHSSGSFLKQFQQWRQQYQKSMMPNEAAPSLDGQPLPGAEFMPEPSSEVAPSRSEKGKEAPVEALPDMGELESEESERGSSSGSALDSSEINTPSEQTLEKPNKQIPASPEQFLI
ncbi:MAG TPA: hypothetical protein V6D07_15440 [Trichocoleus sp.]